MKTKFFSKVKFHRRVLLPVLSLAVVFLLHRLLPTSAKYRVNELPYFASFTALLLLIFAVLAVASIFIEKVRTVVVFKSWFYGAGFLFLGLYDLVTIKFCLIPVLYFPAPERIIEVFIKDWFFLLRCLFYSLRLLLGGFFMGAFLGVVTGTLIGWSQRWNYWIMPFIRVVGPIPSTAWIPVALIVFTRATDASIFLIALGVWFPTTVLTSSGIMNVKNSYFEVSSTLGAGPLHIHAGKSVQRTQRLVQKQHLGVVYKGASQRCPLSHSARKMMGVRFLETFKPNQFEKFRYAVFFSAVNPARAQAKRYIFINRFPWKKRRVLKNQPPLIPGFINHPIVQKYFPGVTLNNPRD